MQLFPLFEAVALSLAALPAGAQMVTDTAVIARSTGHSTLHPYAGSVADAARRFGLPETWIWAVIRVESRGDPRAVSRAGALGLMQLMPATWAMLRVQLGLGNNPFDVRDNIMAGAAYLRAMHDRYGNPTGMLAAYNAGPGRYDDYRMGGRPLPVETRAYVARLASVLDGAADVQVAAIAAAPDRLAWRRSALFVRTAAITPSFGTVQPDRIKSARATAEPMSSNRLFVCGASAVRPQ